MSKKTIPSKDSQKKRFFIPEFNLDVDFARNTIHILDSSTERLLDSKNMDEIKPENVIQKSFKSFKANSESGKNYLVNVDFIKEHDVISTNAEYILDIRMDTPYHGFYFGLYEIGEFEINQENLTLQVIDSFQCKYVGSGAIRIEGRDMKEKEKKQVKRPRFEQKKMIYFGFRESEDDSLKDPQQSYVVRLDWNSTTSENKQIIWKKPVPAPVTSLLIHKNLLYIGLKNGEVQILELLSVDSNVVDGIESELISYKGSTYRVVEKKTSVLGETKTEMHIEKVEFQDEPKVIFNQKVFKGDKGDGEISRIVYLAESSKIAVVGGLRQKRGDIAIFSEDGNLLLNTHLGDAIIRGIAQTESGLFLVNSRGALYHLQKEITKHELEESVIKVKLDKEILSNIIAVRDWICGSGPETLSFFFSKDLKKRSEKHLPDTLARCVLGHEYGVITGDDLGKVRFWKIGDIEVQEE